MGAEETFFVGIENSYQRHFRQIQTFTKEVYTNQNIINTFPQVIHYLYTFQSIDIAMDVVASYIVTHQEVRQLFCHALGECRHQHALAQCGEFLRSHPQFKTTPGQNTAGCAAELAESGRRDAAVIASRSCAALYGLDVIAESISDAQFNYTRFICIAKNLEIYPDSNKISVMLSLPHRPGALNEIISKFAAVGVNLTKLESRPVPGLDFEFRFIFDFEARPGDRAVQALISELSTDPDIERFTFLGAYAEN